ncbi:hypothetical protein Lal_00012386, partial [Lupinus albus]
IVFWGFSLNVVSSGSRLSEGLSLKRENPAYFKNSNLTLSLKRGILAQARISQSQEASPRSSEGFSLKRESHSVNQSQMPFLAQARHLSLRREFSSIAQDFTLPGRRKRVKTSTNRAPRNPRSVRNEGDGGSSSGVGQKFGLDPFYAPALQVERLAKKFGRKPTYIHYADMAWLVEQGFRYPQNLEVQGVVIFLELKGSIYPMQTFSINMVRNTNHAQPTVDDLKLMFPIKEGILVMLGILKSSSRLLAYGIFISHVIDHLAIDTSDVEKIVVNSREHLVGDNMIHKISIYKYDDEWMYLEDHNTTVDLNLSDEDENANQGGQNPNHHDEASNMSQGPSFGLAHLDVMEQRLNERIDSMNDRIMDEFHWQ